MKKNGYLIATWAVVLVLLGLSFVMVLGHSYLDLTREERTTMILCSHLITQTIIVFMFSRSFIEKK